MLSSARARLFRPNSSPALKFATATCCTGFLAGTGIMGWVWGTAVWDTMTERGISLGGKAALTFFLSGATSLTGGVIAGIGLTALTGMFYCCIKSCLDDPFEVVPPNEQGLTVAVDVTDENVNEMQRTHRV